MARPEILVQPAWKTELQRKQQLAPASRVPVSSFPGAAPLETLHETAEEAEPVDQIAGGLDFVDTDATSLKSADWTQWLDCQEDNIY